MKCMTRMHCMKRCLFLPALVLPVLMVLSAGCNIPDPHATKVKGPDQIYAGLAHQLTAILVIVDQRTNIEYSGQMNLDMTRLLEIRLKDHPETERMHAVNSGTRFLETRSVIRYQREHPDINMQPAIEAAPRLQAPRVIYVEIESFSTQSPRSI